MAIGKTLLTCGGCRVKRIVWLPLKAAIKARNAAKQGKTTPYTCIRCSSPDAALASIKAGVA